MKVHFDNVSLGNSSGPNTFALALAKGLFENNHEILLTHDHADVSLVFIEPSGAKLAKKIVQRLDGIWFKPDQFVTHNVNIKLLYENANAVIWQSEFDSNMSKHWWGTPKNGKIIRNSTNELPVITPMIKELSYIRSTYDLLFISSASWHGQKRLKANTDLFLHIRNTNRNKKCGFLVLGNPDYVISDNDVMYLGHQPLNVCLEAYSISDWMIHLAWCDHSPNTVIHAISQNTPVICSEIGGTAELVGKFGMILKENQYNFELADYDNPPSIDVTQIENLLQKDELLQSNVAPMDTVVNEYIKVFENALLS